jgi:multidrug efflux system outer membrane protein
MTSKKLLIVIFYFVIALFIQGCSVNEEIQEISSLLPDAFNQDGANNEGDWPTINWWQQFNSDELNQYIENVQAQNLDLDNNRRNLQLAQIDLREAGFNLIPIPSLSLGMDRATDIESDDYSLTLSLAYGSILSRPFNYQVARFSYSEREAQLLDISMNIISTASSTYFQLLLVRNKIEATELNLQNARTILNIVQSRVEQGVSLPIEELRQTITVQGIEGQLLQLRQDEFALLSALSIMAGETLNDVAFDDTSIDPIEIPRVIMGMPAGLLERRPDLIESRAALQRANSNLNIANVSLLPNLSINGISTNTENSMSDLSQTENFENRLNINLDQLLFFNGDRQRNMQRNNLLLENALNNYRSTVISAFNEVQVLINDQILLEELYDINLSQLYLAEESFRVSQARYSEGLDEFETVLNTQNTLYQQRIDVLNTKVQRLNASIALYIAAGGGWDSSMATADIL